MVSKKDLTDAEIGLILDAIGEEAEDELLDRYLVENPLTAEERETVPWDEMNQDDGDEILAQLTVEDLARNEASDPLEDLDWD